MIVTERISEVHNEDCMIGMARYPDNWFDLKKMKNTLIDFAVLTPKYVSLVYENIERITDRQGRRIHSLCRLNYERLCGVSFRTGATLRRAFRYWSQTNTGSGKDNNCPKISAAKIEAVTGLCIRNKESRKEQQATFCKWGCGFVRTCLFGYKKGWLSTARQHANNNKLSSGQPEWDILRRERNNRPQENFRIKVKPNANANCKGNGLTYCGSQSYGEGGLQAI